MASGKGVTIFVETGPSDALIGWLDQSPAMVSASLKMSPTLSSSLLGMTYLLFFVHH